MALWFIDTHHRQITDRIVDIYLFTFCHFELTERVGEIQTVFSFQTEPETQKLSEQKPGVDPTVKLTHTFIFSPQIH